MTKEETRTCPFCKEDIKAEAIKCKPCRSNVVPDRPDHEGVCPFCKEEVKLKAIKCKHCGSQIGDAEKTCCCSEHVQGFTPDRAQLFSRRSPGYTVGDLGDECFDHCYGFMTSNPRVDKRYAHRFCEEYCQISMPPRALRGGGAVYHSHF